MFGHSTLDVRECTSACPPPSQSLCGLTRHVLETWSAVHDSKERYADRNHSRHQLRDRSHLDCSTALRASAAPADERDRRTSCQGFSAILQEKGAEERHGGTACATWAYPGSQNAVR